MFGFFVKSESDQEFVNQVVSSIKKEIFPEATTEKIRSLSVNKVTRVLEKIAIKFVEYEKKESLGKFKKAKILNDLQWKLRDAGYSKEFVSLISEALLAKSMQAKEK